jgi:hypothetical protein
MAHQVSPFVSSSAARCLTAALLTLFGAAGRSDAQVLVGNPYISPYTSWVDAFPPPTRAGNWRLSLHNPTLMDTNNANPPNTGAMPHDGTYQPDVLIQNNFLAPANYELSATMRTNDDDLMGLVWNYQDPNNYFRVGLRQQLTSGNFGGTEGLSVQKIVGGVVTQLFPSTPMAGPVAITQPMIDGRTPFDVRVAVTGTNYEVFFNGTSMASGSDPALAAGRKIGVQSWAQQSDAAAVTPFWGSEFETISVKQGATTLFSENFGNRPVKFRQLTMVNQAGVSGLTGTTSREILGNFGLDIDNPWIYQQGNGNLNATVANTDFIGPAVVVDEPGSASLANYEMRTRIGASDNDGFGVLVRVQNDTNFYRINFTAEGPGTGTTRPPLGLSVQKVRNGTWSELFRDSSYVPAVGSDAAPATPLTGLPMHDLSVGVVGNSIKIQLKDNLGIVHNYPVIVDSSDPILTGSVGLASWGSVHDYYMSYGGVDGPLVTALNAFNDFDATINRDTGNISLTNNGAAPVGIKGISITSAGGALNPVNWISVANAYDEPPGGNGSVDPDDPWTITSSTALNMSEAEQSGGNGGSLGVGQTINLGNAWIKSRIEDVTIQLQLTAGGSSFAGLVFSGGPGGASFARSDLNTDGVVNAADWPLFYPNMLANLSSFTAVGKALRGDVDGDGDNDVNDFQLFKDDFDVANGAGAFAAMINNVPEPSTAALVFAAILGGIGIRRRRTNRFVPAVACGISLLTMAGTASATAVDLTTYSVEQFPHADSDAEPATDFFPQAIWTVTPTSATHNGNSDQSVLYSPTSALNKRYIGQVRPGTDDDVLGFVLGFEPGDSQIFSSADYLLIDWKGATQNFNFTDYGAANFFHDQTPAGSMPVGLALSRVTGSATADEMWQHVDYSENPSGTITELARATTLGSAAYNRANGSHLFDIRYTATNVTVLIDGVEELNVNGSFPNGRFGLYTAYQSPVTSFSNVHEFSAGGFTGLTATVDRSDGEITLSNPGTDPVEFDFYQINSASSSLNVAGWDSLSDKNFQSVGGGNGQSWDEAGGSNASALAEMYLQSRSSLAGGAMVSLGSAYSTSGDEDLVIQYRLPSSFPGLFMNATINYIGTAPGLQGDYNGDGKVDAADYVVWRKTDGTQNGYNTWRTNFGRTSGSGASLAGATSVPEPATCSLVGLILLAWAPRRRG